MKNTLLACLALLALCCSSLPAESRFERAAREKKARAAEVVWFSHEPLMFSQRKGKMPEDWPERYERQHSPENIARMAALGARYGRLHFFKGFGLETEMPEIHNSMRAAESMHGQGMKVSLYLGGTMFTETFYREMPAAQGWEQRDQYGRPVPYIVEAQTWRHFACPNEPAWRAYIKRVLDVGIDSLHADEFFFDNYLLRKEPKSCRCERCMKAFHEFLYRRYPTPEAARARFGYPDTDWLQPSQWDDFNRPEDLAAIDDPVLQEWISFRCESLADQCREFYNYIKARDPHIAVGFNLKGVYSLNRIWENAVYHPLFAGRCDFFCFDIPGVAPGLDSSTGALVSEIRSYKTGRRLGIACPNGGPDMELAEQMAFNYVKPIPGYGWLGLGDNHYAERHFSALAEFFREYSQRYYTGVSNIADVAVLRSWPSMAYSVGGPWIEATLAEQVLIQHHVPFDIIYDEQTDSLSRYQAVILAGQESLSLNVLERLLTFTREGGTLVFSGESGYLNEYRQARTVNPLLAALGDSRPSTVSVRELGKGKLVYVPPIAPGMKVTPAEGWQFPASQWVLPANHEEILHAVSDNLPRGLSVQAEAPLTTALEIVRRPETSETLLHFVNYDPAHPLVAFRAQLALERAKVRAVKFLSPEQDNPVPLEFAAAGAGRITFQVPGFGQYGLVVVVEK